VLETWARGLKLPFIGVLREAQAYVRCVEQGLTVFDLPDAQAQADVAQWKPIVAWLDPVLRTVRRPELRGNPSVERPAPVLGEAVAPRAVVDEAAAIVAAEPAPSNHVFAPPLPVKAATPLVPRPTVVEPMARAAPARLGLFAWLTPRFLHR
jgi:chromosome partitioning protein